MEKKLLDKNFAYALMFVLSNVGRSFNLGKSVGGLGAVSLEF